MNISHEDERSYEVEIKNIPTLIKCDKEGIKLSLMLMMNNEIINHVGVKISPINQEV